MTHSPDPMRLKIASIAVGERIGFFSEAHAKRLGESMAEQGQHAPIQVRRNGNAAKLPWTLVAGLHRLRGAEQYGWVEIAAIQVADKSATPDHLRRLELGENLSHMVRRPIERAIMMAEYARLEEAVDHPGHVGECPRARGARMTNSAPVTMPGAETYLHRTAIAFDVSLSTLERHLRIYRAIAADDQLSDLAEKLNAHPLGESFSAMTTIAQIKMSDTRRKAALAVLGRQDWPNVQAALVHAGLAGDTGNRVDPSNHRALISTTWEKMPLNEQRAFVLEDLPRKLTPGMARNLVTRLVKEFQL